MGKLFTTSLVLLMAGLWTGTPPVAAQTKICVVSDTHFFDPDLLINDGVAFQTYLAYDRKMLKESKAILESVFQTIEDEVPAYLFVSGDLTKDGEKTGHQKMAEYFRQLEEKGIQVLVTPGNHDINNPHAVSFDGNATTQVESITPDEFKTIYQDFGFSQATAVHQGSLSYVYPLDDELVLISMDVCRYVDNVEQGSPETSGGFTPSLLEWTIEQAQLAKAAGKKVIGMMHHGLLEHYIGQKTIMDEYVIDDWENISSQLAESGFQAVFTGHYHAQDIVMKSTTNGSTIFDIETGSTVTYPCPYRVVTYENKKLSVSGGRVTNIDYDLGSKENFQTYARDFIEAGLPTLVKGMLMSPPYSLSTENATLIEPAVTEAFVAHYAGNEGTPSETSQAIIAYLMSSGYASIGYILNGMWDDPQPDDWTYVIDMANNPTFVVPQQKSSDIQIVTDTSGNIAIISRTPLNNASVSVYNLLGEKFYQRMVNGDQFTIASSSFPTGIYVVKINGDEVKTSTKVVLR
ncbi:MAG: metallophosphoesterase [Breznakibacter sp.]